MIHNSKVNFNQFRIVIETPNDDLTKLAKSN